jgi:hypothetical protein
VNHRASVQAAGAGLGTGPAGRFKRHGYAVVKTNAGAREPTNPNAA